MTNAIAHAYDTNAYRAQWWYRIMLPEKERKNPRTKATSQQQTATDEHHLQNDTAVCATTAFEERRC